MIDDEILFWGLLDLPAVMVLIGGMFLSLARWRRRGSPLLLVALGLILLGEQQVFVILLIEELFPQIVGNDPAYYALYGFGCLVRAVGMALLLYVLFDGQSREYAALEFSPDSSAGP